ncbi:MAG: DUF5320 domain-containing protein [Anaerolineales bacterium]
MPYRDGTGPTGQGSRTGRGAGNCTGQGGRRGFGRSGRGLGTGRGFNRAAYSSDMERTWLEDQVKSLQSALQSITERLDALKKE